METIESVKFGFFTEGEVKKHSFVKVTNATLLDSVNMPMPGGLYDPAMGPLDDHSLCRSCGQRAFHCPGHCGHIDLIAPVYNPLLFDFLHNILQSTCFFCHHFRADRSQVERCASQLKLIIKGDIIGAKRLGSMSLDECSDLEDSVESIVSCSIDPSDAQYNVSVDLKRQKWTSLQLTEAISVLDNFLKQKYRACKRCEAKSKDSMKTTKSKNPKITKPVFGWFHMAMSAADAKANVIRGSKLEGHSISECEYKKKDANYISSGENLKKGKEVHTEFIKQKNLFSGPLLPSEVKDIIKLLWENEVQLCSFINDIQRDPLFINKAGHSMFFLDTVLVPPIKFRPPSKGGDSVMEHPQTVLLSKVLQANISLGNAHINNMERSKIVTRWIELQQSINVLFDSKKATGQREIPSGICQLLEKKEGIFRQKMMGKRVNFACRSVISPDPYLAVNEIGIPPYFALRLTYPEKVNPFNSNKLRDAIINGPEIHPGATHYVDNMSTLLLRPGRKARMPVARKLQSSRGVVTQPRKSCDYEFEGKYVYRHLQDGDIVLVNRQPTLHKPSIMAHVVRVLKGEKTLRMHYANCSSYNADFDGDEMNVHLPQDEISRAEAYSIVNANNQYIVPTQGEPLRGLIQDHIVSAVLLTKMNTFLSQEQYSQLLYSSGVCSCGPVSSFHKPGQKVCVMSSENEMKLPNPAIQKPEPLWTGKQVITAVLNHITRGYPPFTIEKEGKISRSYFTSMASAKAEHPGEETLFISRNELLRGVIDKAQFAKYGLVHMVHELYGSSAAGNLLSALSRLFTVFLQMHGFTCGVDDLLLSEHSDKTRKDELQKCEEVAEKVHLNFIGFKAGEIGPPGPMELQMKIEKAIRSTGESAVARLDGLMRSELNDLTNEANKKLFPDGLLKPFPENCFNLMTTTGAKGSAVNFQQVSSLLGQQVLEGKRVPRMVSGKTLPCFHPWDWKSRAGGYIIDNFLTGLRPQEYYFHCMAGREGLVDTAVKTSRSGYLQRCLIKNLESLKICYDHTVRDIDGSIIQFNYGEDGVDVHQTSFIDRFESLELNHEFFHKNVNHQQGKFNNYIVKLPSLLEEKARIFGVDLEKRQGNINYKDFMKLVEHKYFSSLAQPGEPVGVIAAQSVGEPSTQMTLNTFHHAGRGEMNVTLGIPRLQEIIMTASNDIKTPIMTCPLQKGRSEDDAKSLAAKLKKVSLIDIVESINVSVEEQTDFSRIYKLKMTLYKSELHPPKTNISLKNCRKVLRGLFLWELEDAIQNHLFLLSRISGIKNFVPDTPPKASNDTYEDVSGGGQQGGEVYNDDDDDDGGGGNDEEDIGDLGLDVQKQKQQARDEVEYDDGSEEYDIENDLNGSEIVDEISQDWQYEAEDGTSEISRDDEIGQYDAEDRTSEMSPDLGKLSERKSKDKKMKPVHKKGKNLKDKVPRKETDRAIFVSAKGLHFEVHFKFTNEPHVLLYQIAQKAAKKVYVNNSGKIDQCTPCDCSERQVIYYGEDPEPRKAIPPAELKKIPALHTAGLDFNAFWKMQDDLDIRYIYTNNIRAMLNTYGVEAARDSIIREIQTVFGSYGVTVDIRHLTLIADYMTHSGGYRPMSRNGGILESVSPFNKISFETAAKFIREAAYHGLTDNLESPSARICLGLPVKLGTGCFDLMQKVEI